MRCPKCGYNSFDHLDSCKKCGGDLLVFKEKHGLRGLLFRGRPTTAVAEAPFPQESAKNSGLDFDFAPPAADATPLEQESEGTGEGPRPGEAMEDTFPLNDVPLFGPLSVPTVTEDFDPWAAPTGDLPAPAAEYEDDSATPRESGIFDWAQEDAPEPLLPLSGYSFDKGPPLWSRLAASLADLALLALIFALFILAGNAILFPGEARGIILPLEDLLLLSTPYFLVLFSVCFGYFTLFHYLTGQTPGKMAFRLRIEAEQGGAPSFSQAFLRSIGGLLSLLTAGAGYLLIPLSREGRGWNDRLAGTRVVQGGLRQPEPAQSSAPADPVD